MVHGTRWRTDLIVVAQTERTSVVALTYPVGRRAPSSRDSCLRSLSNAARSARGTGELHDTLTTVQIPEFKPESSGYSRVLLKHPKPFIQWQIPQQ